MKWQADNNEVIKPKEGDTKKKTRFSIFPTKVNGNWILFEKYTSIYEYKYHLVYSEEVVSSGLFTEKVQGWYHNVLGWVFSHRIDYNNQSNKKSTMRNLLAYSCLTILIGLVVFMPKIQKPNIKPIADKMYLNGLEKDYIDNIHNKDTIEFLRGRCRMYLDNLNK